MPEKHVPVFVASIEECASAILAPGNVVFWPTDLLAVYRSPTMGTVSCSLMIQRVREMESAA